MRKSLGKVHLPRLAECDSGYTYLDDPRHRTADHSILVIGKRVIVECYLQWSSFVRVNFWYVSVAFSSREQLP